MAVLAKFKVSSVEQFEYSGRKVNMQAVYPKTMKDGTLEFTNPEDEAFWEATPSGMQSLNINNPLAAEQFQPGDEWYVRYERVPKDGNGR